MCALCAVLQELKTVRPSIRPTDRLVAAIQYRNKHVIESNKVLILAARYSTIAQEQFNRISIIGRAELFSPVEKITKLNVVPARNRFLLISSALARFI